MRNAHQRQDREEIADIPNNKKNNFSKINIFQKLKILYKLIFQYNEKSKKCKMSLYKLFLLSGPDGAT